MRAKYDTQWAGVQAAARATVLAEVATPSSLKVALHKPTSQPNFLLQPRNRAR